MAWIDRAARRAAASDAPDRLSGITRRQALKGFAAGALLAGPAGSLLTTAPARGASCLRVEPTCLRTAEDSFLHALGACPRGTLWEELRCRVAAQNTLGAARQACRIPDDSRCPEGHHCDAGGGCTAGPPPDDDESGPVGSGPCAHDYPTAASVAAARQALAAGEPVVSLSPGGCMRLERAQDGDATTERMTLAGVVVSEHVTTPAGATVRRDDDGDGYFEYVVETAGPLGDETGTVLTRRDPATKRSVRRETRTFSGTTVKIVIEEDGELANQYVADVGSVAAIGWWGGEEGEYCGNERDARFGSLFMKALGRTARCLERHNRPDLAGELLQAGGRITLLCGDLEDANAIAIDAPVGNTSGRGRIILDPAALEEMASDDSRMQTLMHELMHYTSLGLHDPAQAGDNLIPTGAHNSDRVYACARLCTLQKAVNQCQCATCLEKTTCSKECKPYIECNTDMGAICPCEDRHKWYPTYADCVEDCPKGLKCFGHSKCKNLDKRC